jgi:DNA-binding NarL/FixJ family response regulator
MTEKQMSFIYDAQSGESEMRELTPNQIIEREQIKAQILARQEKLESEVAARESALAKLSALGLTEEEIAAL